MQNSVIDLIIRIKNGYMARRESIDVSSSHFNEAVLMKLMQLGFIKKFQAKDRIIQLELLYK